LITSSNDDTSKSTSWKVLEDALSHHKNTANPKGFFSFIGLNCPTTWMLSSNNAFLQRNFNHIMFYLPEHYLQRAKMNQV